MVVPRFDATLWQAKLFSSVDIIFCFVGVDRFQAEFYAYDAAENEYSSDCVTYIFQIDGYIQRNLIAYGKWISQRNCIQIDSACDDSVARCNLADAIFMLKTHKK